jgi:uncharacterized membrane protein
MKLLHLVFKRESAAPVLALTFASAVSVVLVVTRIVWTSNIRYAFLIWNLFLAWLPLVFAALACEQPRNGSRPGWRLTVLAGAWLLFFPNAPYIFTDLIHLPWFQTQVWADLALILTFAVTGLVLGFVSLYLMQSIVTRMCGRVAGWLFVLAAAGLSSLGVYVGRFLRLNSWDMFLRPGKIYDGIGVWIDGRTPHFSTTAFLLFFAAFFFATYVMLFALTHLPKARFCRKWACKLEEVATHPR